MIVRRHRGLASEGTAGDWAAQYLIQAGDEIDVAERPAGSLATPQRGESRLVVPMASQQHGEVSHAIEQRFDRHEFVVPPRQMGPDARPSPIVRSRYEAGANRIEADVACSRDQVRIVHRNGRKAALKKVAAPARPRVDEMGVAALRLSHRPSQTRAVARNDNKVNVIRHQAVCPNLDAKFARLLGRQVAIDFLVAVLEKDRLAPIATLRDVVRNIRNDDARETGHARNLRCCVDAGSSSERETMSFFVADAPNDE